MAAGIRNYSHENIRSSQPSVQSCLYKRKQGLVPFKPVIYEFIQTRQIVLRKRLTFKFPWQLI